MVQVTYMTAPFDDHMRSDPTGADMRKAGSLQPHALWPAILLAAAGLLGLAAVQLSAADGSGQYLVIVAPWRTQAETIDMIGRADGGVAGFGAWSSVAIAMASGPDFPARLRAQGAWLVVPSPRILGCAAPVAGAAR